MNVLQIIKKFLKENEYDGLYNEDQECACKINDLVPCDSCFAMCKPGYKVQCKSEECEICHGYCVSEIDNDYNWHIQEEKPK